MILISACLTGVPCRYNGSCFNLPKLLSLVEKEIAVQVCPETAGGLPVPRNCIEIGENHRAIESTGIDRSKEIKSGINQILSSYPADTISAAVLKDKSPSCGSCLIYDGSFTGKTIPGKGLFADTLYKLGIPVYHENNYNSLLKITF
ncbi:MAG: DUF523 domain-containing protein [Bacteroidetes bacterium]|nr:DUF523 domain-containing protein [Bacteroidota bacterium]